MFGFLKRKSLTEKCRDQVIFSSGCDERQAENYVRYFEKQYQEAFDEGERKIDFMVAWCAVSHLAKISDLQDGQAQFLASQAPDIPSGSEFEDITIKICRVAQTQASGDMATIIKDGLKNLENR